MMRINGFQPVLRLRENVDRVLNELADGGTWCPAVFGLGRGTFPAVNVWEDDRNLYAEAEVAGLAMENLEVLVHGNELTLQGNRPEANSEGVTYHRRERGLGEFRRLLRLPVEIDADKVLATLREGVLTITLPKAQSVLPRKIEVKG